tara:strand:+ start:3002 stop:3166 length:165 start_codon:yes stop_codon:yes gene_type:complete
MDLKEAYKSWQKKNPDEHFHMESKRQLKRRTIKLWSIKTKGAEARKKRREENGK